MSFTGRPSSPPLALMSSSQICMATSDILPLAASGPVSAIPNPILIGSAACTGGALTNSKLAAASNDEKTFRLSQREFGDMFHSLVWLDFADYRLSIVLQFRSRSPGQGIEKHERSSIRAIFFPFRTARVAREVSRTVRVVITDRADPPENLVSFWYGPANLLDIEIQGSHSEQQKIRLAGTQSREFVKLGSA